MSRWVRLDGADAVPQGTGWSFETEEGAIAVFNVDGDLYAIDDSCPHMGSSLGMGRLDGCIVTCRGHGLTFDVTTGQRGASELRTRSFLLERRPDGVYADLEEPVI